MASVLLAIEAERLGKAGKERIASQEVIVGSAAATVGGAAATAGGAASHNAAGGGRRIPRRSIPRSHIESEGRARRRRLGR